MAAQSNRSTSICLYLCLQVFLVSIISCKLTSYAQETCHATDETCTDPARLQSDEAPFWHEYSIDDFFSHFNCFSILPGYADGDDDDEIDQSNSPQRSINELQLDTNQITDMTRQLEQFRSKYRTEVHSVPIPDRSLATKSIRVPFVAGDAGSKGRGIYAAELIRKGTLVQDTSTDNVGVFKDAETWRRYTYTLGEADAEAACNFMEWCWVQYIPKEADVEDIRQGWTVFIAFDESGLLNNAEWGVETANLRCGTPPSDEGGEWGPCTYYYYATRDIEAGEELLVNYSEFEDKSQVGWVEFGVGAIVQDGIV